MNEKGPIYGEELLDTLPVNVGALLQQLPSREDLEGVLGYRRGQRVVAGYEVAIKWLQEAIRIMREIDKRVVDDAVVYDEYQNPCVIALVPQDGWADVQDFLGRVE